MPRMTFVGRRHELTQLQAGLERILDGRGAAFLVAGEPGIGKTRLADELSALAAQQGVRMFWGRCWEGGGAPAFWPWVQILRAVTVSDLWPPVARDAPALAIEISQLVPDLAVAANGESAQRAQPLDPEQARFRLFDAITQTLKRVASAAPLGLVLDDLHDADLPSLLLLRFLAREIRDTRIFLLGTYRDAEARRSPTLAPIFGHLARESQCFHLAGLSAAEVERFIDETVHLQLPRSIKEEVHRTTEGNPFYVDEVARLLAARPSIDADTPAHRLVQIPDTVRAAIRERLTPLTDKAREVLTIAAALGREFETMPIERIIPDGDAVAAAIDEALQLGIIRKTNVPARLVFSHTLIRDTIHDDLPAADRAQLHHRVADELERRARAGVNLGAAQLAHHFLLALPVGSADQAITYSIRAGDEALQQLAYEEAVRHYRDAQRILEQHGSEPSALAELLLKLGDAQRWAADLSTGRNTFHRVATIARRLLAQTPSATAVALLARAALGYARVSETGQVDYGLIALLEEALAAVGDEDSALRSRLLARLAVGLYFSADHVRRDAYSREAVAMAERIGDRSALVNAAIAHHFTIWGPDSLDERLRVATQVVRLCEELGEHETELEARAWRITDLIEGGQVETAAAEHQSFVRLAEHHRVPLYLWYARMQQAMYATLEGRFDDADDLSQEAARIGARAELPNAGVFLISQSVALRVLQGRGGEIEAQIRDLADRIPSMPVWRVGHTLALLQSEHLSEARQELEQLSAEGFAGIPRDGMWLSCMALLAQACVLLEDRARAQQLYDLLLPYEDRICVAASAISTAGPVSLVLGRLALLLDRSESAQAHLQKALILLARMRSSPYTAAAQLGLAMAIAAADRQRACDLAAQAAAAARHLGMRDLDALASRFQAELGGTAATTADKPVDEARPAHGQQRGAPASTNTPDALPANTFRREGEFWSVSFEGTVLRMKDSKGLRYIRHLLAHPGNEFHSIDLASVSETGGGATAVQQRALGDVSVVADLGDCGEVLDTRAIAAYKRRVRDLQEELTEATDFNDLGRMQSLQEEIAILTQQLASATGLGGRQRRAGAHAEQARINVTKAISSAIKKMRADHPALGRFLASSIKTGTFCTYEPDPAKPVAWEL